jgi:hypothetical protein
MTTFFMIAILNPTLVNGFILGWSVAWPLGSINAEIIRRSLLPHSAGGEGRGGSAAPRAMLE